MALRHYAGEGVTTCAVDFEAFNPEATAFWLRHFTPVCFSLMRVPEALPERDVRGSRRLGADRP